MSDQPPAKTDVKALAGIIITILGGATGYGTLKEQVANLQITVAELKGERTAREMMAKDLAALRESVAVLGTKLDSQSKQLDTATTKIDGLDERLRKIRR